MEQRVYLLCSS